MTKSAFYKALRPYLPLIVAGFALQSTQQAKGDDVAALVAKTDALYSKLNDKDALPVILEAVKQAPHDSNVLRRVAREYAECMSDTTVPAEKLALGNKAIEYSELAIRANPKDANAYLSLAISYGRVAPLLDTKAKIATSKQVKDNADMAMSLDSKNDLTYHVLGVWNLELANINGFLRFAVKLIYGGLPPASNENAEMYLKKAIALNPNRLGSYIQLGRVYAAMGRKPEARAMLQKGMAMPNHDKDDPHIKQKGQDALNKL